jgi:hypothetical protein
MSDPTRRTLGVVLSALAALAAVADAARCMRCSRGQKIQGRAGLPGDRLEFRSPGTEPQLSFTLSGALPNQR